MTAQRWRQLEELYDAVRDLPPAERNALLDRSDPELRASLEAILRQDGCALDRPAWMGREALLQSDILPPRTELGPYRIEETIGCGGMGEVYRAVDTRLGRSVAIKLLPRELTADPAYRRRLLQEARAVSALNHPNIVVLYDISCHEGADFLVMEYVAGRSLKELIPPEGPGF